MDFPQLTGKIHHGAICSEDEGQDVARSSRLMMAEIGTDISKAMTILREGKLVAIPTETVYGLAGNALNVDAVTRIFVAKNRPYFDPLIVHVSDPKTVADYSIEIPDVAFALMEQFWPGPLTVLLRKKNNIPDLVTAGLDRVALRCPDHPMTLALLRSLSFPLAAPSANPFGYVSPTTARHVHDQLGNEIEYILDGGECKVGIESTIVGFEGNTAIIYRLGGLGVEAIEAVVGKVRVSVNSASDPQAPGQLLSHYAPRKPVVIGEVEALFSANHSKSVGLLSFKDAHPLWGIRKEIVLSPTGSVDEAAQKLFAALRELDKSPVDIIIAELVPDVGLGRAINDRLRRAAT